MYIIGVTGPIDSGKTTFLDYLGANFKTEMHLESSDLIMEVANDLRITNIQRGQSFPTVAEVPLINNWLMLLPDILRNRTSTEVPFDVIEITPEKINAEPELYSKLAEYLALMQERPELQTGYITAGNKDQHRSILQWLGGFMYKKVSPKIWYEELMRRAHEEPLVSIVTVGGVRFPGDVECIRQNDGRIIEMTRPNTIAQDSSDVTERERSLIQPDVVIVNDGTLDQLKNCAHQLALDMRDKIVKDRYNSSDF